MLQVTRQRNLAAEGPLFNSDSFNQPSISDEVLNFSTMHLYTLSNCSRLNLIPSSDREKTTFLAKLAKPEDAVQSIKFLIVIEDCFRST